MVEKAPTKSYVGRFFALVRFLFALFLHFPNNLFSFAPRASRRARERERERERERGSDEHAHAQSFAAGRLDVCPKQTCCSLREGVSRWCVEGSDWASPPLFLYKNHKAKVEKGAFPIGGAEAGKISPRFGLVFAHLLTTPRNHEFLRHCSLATFRHQTLLTARPPPQNTRRATHTNQHKKTKPAASQRFVREMREGSSFQY